MRFTVIEKQITLGNRKGQKGYQAVPEGNSKLSLERLIDIVVDETSLGAGDTRNAIITMTKIVKRYLSDGISVDMGELGSFRVNVASKVLSDPLEVTAAKALRKPKIVYTPKQDLREAVADVKLQVVNPYRQTSPASGGDEGGASPDPSQGGENGGNEGGSQGTGTVTPDPGTGGGGGNSDTGGQD